MAPSRGIIVLGMHRSGTSAFARGLASLGVYLGDNFLEVRDDNPTGYWEDPGILDLNERLLAALGRDWTTPALLVDGDWQGAPLHALRAEAMRYLAVNYLVRPVWGFKDPRTILLLPFWRAVFDGLGVDDRYLVAVRNPLSVAVSLRRRQQMEESRAHLLWLVYVVPFLHAIAARPFVVADYDLLIDQPEGQLGRIAEALELSMAAAEQRAVAAFARNFLDAHLRHSQFQEHDFATIPRVSPLTHEAYRWLRAVATDQLARDAAEFRTAWERLHVAVRQLLQHAPFAA